MRRYLTRVMLLLFTLSIFAFSLPGQAAASGYTVVVNGVTIQGAQAELRNGQLMVAVRPYVAAMGGTVEWLDWAKRATITQNGSQMAMWVGTTTVYQNNVKLWAPVAPYLLNGQMMVPAWWLAVRLGAKVSFSGTTLTVNNGYTPPVPAPVVPQDPLMNPGYYFPFAAGAPYEPWTDTWNASRSYDGSTFGHEGTDIFAPKGTPIVSVAPGTVIRYGWNTLGGWRLTIQLDDAPTYKFYYAHMSAYAPGIAQGTHVTAGQVIGYVGNTGEGPEGTVGAWPTHLHFGLYDANFNAINPYTYLRYYEAHQINL